MTPDPDFFTYKNCRIATYQIGEGPPLLLLHGWASSAKVMMPIARQLAHLRTCHLIDLPGFGQSDEPPEAWSVNEYADMVDAFIQTLRPKPVDLLAHSYGGRITLKILADKTRKDQVGKVLITGGAGMKPRRTFSYYIKKSVSTLLKIPARILPSSLRESYLRKVRSSRLWKKLGSSDYRKLSGVMRESFVLSVRDHLDSLLPSIQHEVLLLWGDRDDATPLYQGERMEKGINRSALVIMEGAGHYAFLDKPKQFAAIAEAYYEPGEANG
ncbi:MAG: alpha/beta hydrolase [Balneolaceae bacterium]